MEARHPKLRASRLARLRDIAELGNLVLQLVELPADDKVSQRQLVERVVRFGIASSRAWLKAEPNLLKLKITLADTLMRMQQLANTYGSHDPDRDRAWMLESRALTASLVASFPNDVDVMALRGRWCDPLTEDIMTCLRALNRCRSLQGELGECGSNYDYMARGYMAPRCARADIRPDLGFRADWPTARNGTDRIVDGRNTYYRERVPTFKANAIREIMDVHAAHTDQSGLHLSLTPDQQAAFADWTEVLAKANGRIVLQTNTTVVVAARPVRRLTGESLRIEAALNDLCRNVELRALPADLPAPRTESASQQERL